MENGTPANSTAHPAGLLWSYQTLVACPAPSCQVALVQLFEDSVFLLFLASPQCVFSSFPGASSIMNRKIIMS